MKKIFYFFLLIFISKLSFATHNMAGDISYTHISGYTYKITIRTFTNTYNTTADRCELMVYFGDGDSVMAPRINGPSTLCPNTHDGIFVGACIQNVKSNIYETTHTYPGANGTYIITVSDPNRAAGILNITNSVNTLFHLQAEIVIDPFIGTNSSATYLNNILVVCGCVGVPYNFNPGFYDAEGDSLYYENSLLGGAGYSNPSASSEFRIDSLTGDVIWNNPTTIGVYVYDIKVSEWRLTGGVRQYIGSSMMEVWNPISACTGISENISNTILVTVYPNPATDVVNFSIENRSEKEKYVLKIQNQLGQTIRTIDFDNNSNIPYNISGLSSGLYFYTVKTTKALLTQGKFEVLTSPSK